MMKSWRASSIVLLPLLVILCHGVTEEVHLRDGISNTIQVEDGDIFDCININMQPALRHPLVRNHSIQMAPSTYPIGMDEKPAVIANSELKLNSIACPPGTIPIWSNHTLYSSYTSTMGDVNQEKFLVAEGRFTPSFTPYFAGYGAHLRVHGIQASMSVYEPAVKLGKDQFRHSAAKIQVESRNGEEHVGAGWAVSPSIYGDKYARFHIYWRDRYETCLDHSCPGFVQVSSDVGLGSRLTPVSVYGGAQYQIELLLFKDPKTGNWWLAFGKNKKLIGYWPKSLFKFLDKGGDITFWGGEVIVPSIEPSCPMGSAHFPFEGFGKAAFIANAKFVDEHDMLVTPNANSLKRWDGKPKCYQVGDAGIQKGGLDFFFGGPGGCKG